MYKNIYGFWIDPEGKSYAILDDFGHKPFMEKQLNKEFESSEDAVQEALENGWIRIVNGPNSFMVDYRYIIKRKQLETIEELELKLQEDGYKHTSFILSYGREYYFFDDVYELIKRIKARSC